MPLGSRRPEIGRKEQQMQTEMATNSDKGQGPKFTLDIEGTLKSWDDDSITTEQIAALGGWDVALGVLIIDKDNNERTLQAGETVELKPGMGFSKKVRFRRG